MKLNEVLIKANEVQGKKEPRAGREPEQVVISVASLRQDMLTMTDEEICKKHNINLKDLPEIKERIK